MSRRSIVLVSFLAACGGSTPAPAPPVVAPPDAGVVDAAPPADAGIPVAVQLVGAGGKDDWLVPGASIATDGPIVAGTPTTVRITIIAPPGPDDAVEYRGYAPEFPMHFTLEPVDGATVDPAEWKRVTAYSKPPVVWTADAVTFPFTVTASAPGPLPLAATVTFGTCSRDACWPGKAGLHWTLDVRAP